MLKVEEAVNVINLEVLEEIAGLAKSIYGVAKFTVKKTYLSPEEVRNAVI